MEGNLAMRALRTGENTGGYASALGEEQRQASRDLAGTLAGADADRLNKLTAIEQQGVEAAKFPAGVYGSLYGTSTGGAASAGSNAANAAKTPGFWDTFAPALVGAAGTAAAGTAAAGMCPRVGSLITMADGSRKPVEQLRKGDWLWAPGTLTAPNQLLEDPTPRQAACWEIETRGGLVHGGSDTHSIALATGGYALMPEMEGKTVIGDQATDVVVSVKDAGEDTVYLLNVGGSHSYMADGIMVLA